MIHNVFLLVTTVLLDGYDKMCNASKKMQPMLYELEREHLHPFGLTWRMLNKRIYQRFVYWEVRELIPQCLLMVSGWTTVLNTPWMSN